MAAKKIIDDLKELVSIVRASLQAKTNAKKHRSMTKYTAKKKPAKNPADPMLLARSVVEAAIGEPLTHPKPKKKIRKSK